MCGIFGVVNSSTRRESDLSKYIKEAMVVGSLRGRDGIGMFQVEGPYDVTEHSPYLPRVIVDKYGMDGAIAAHFAEQRADGKGPVPITYMAKNAGEAWLTVGHHRAATVGSTTQANAHPFTVKREDGTMLVGVHNGTLNMTKAEMGSCEVDSQALMIKLAADADSDNPYVNALGTTFGALATVFYDTKYPGQVFMYTNGQRPLHFAFLTACTDMMLVASEAEMLYWLASRNRMGLNKGEILSCKSRVLYKFNYQGKLMDYLTTEVPYTTASTSVYTGGNYASTYEDEATEYADVWDGWRAHRGSYTTTTTLEDEVRKALAQVLAEPAANEPVASAESPKVSKRPPLCSPEEQKRLMESLLITPGTEVEFEYEMFINDPLFPDRGTAAGNVIVTDTLGETDIFAAVIRHMTHEKAKELAGKVAICKAIGADVSANAANNRLEFEIILTHPRQLVDIIPGQTSRLVN